MLTPVQGYSHEGGAMVTFEEELSYGSKAVDVRVFPSQGSHATSLPWTVEWCEYRPDASQMVRIACESRDTAALVARVWIGAGKASLG